MSMSVSVDLLCVCQSGVVDGSVFVLITTATTGAFNACSLPLEA
jgi:hypothetical protein